MSVSAKKVVRRDLCQIFLTRNIYSELMKVKMFEILKKYVSKLSIFGFNTRPTPPNLQSTHGTGEFVGTLVIGLNFSMKTNSIQLAKWFNINIFKSDGTYSFNFEPEQYRDVPVFEDYDNFDICHVQLLFVEDSEMVKFQEWNEPQEHRVWDNANLLTGDCYDSESTDEEMTESTDEEMTDSESTDEEMTDSESIMSL